MMRALVLWAVVALGSLPSHVHANNRDKADALFKQGKKLMADKRYADACDAFEASNKLDPGIGTQLNIARCYEQWGKLARALAAYLAAERMAIDAKDARAPKIRELVVKLEPNVPKLTIRAPRGAPDDLGVTLDGRPVDRLGEAMNVDPGPHTIEWTIPGGETKRKTVPLDRGSESEITLDIPPSSGTAIGKVVTSPRTDNPTPHRPGRTQRMAGIGLAGAGVVAFGVSSYMTLSARSDYRGALATHCGGMKDRCDMTGLEITRDARSTANQATVVFLVGAALVGGGAALYFLAPTASPASEPARREESQVYVTPAISPGVVGFVLGGAL